MARDTIVSPDQALSARGIGGRCSARWTPLFHRVPALRDPLLSPQLSRQGAQLVRVHLVNGTSHASPAISHHTFMHAGVGIAHTCTFGGPHLHPPARTSTAVHCDTHPYFRCPTPDLSTVSPCCRMQLRLHASPYVLRHSRCNLVDHNDILPRSIEFRTHVRRIPFVAGEVNAQP